MTAPPVSTPRTSVYELQPHPSTASPFVRAITAELVLKPDDPQLVIRYRLSGRIEQVRLPAWVDPPGPADGLWQHSCFEAFFGSSEGPAYHEFNFSPSGQWAAYAFSGARLRYADTHEAISPGIRPTMSEGRDELILEASLPRLMIRGPLQRPVHVGLSAVIETLDGSLSYWALHHPTDRPDFHRKDGWTASLANL